MITPDQSAAYYEARGLTLGEQPEDPPDESVEPDCRLCGDTGYRCPKCDPDYYRDAAMDR